jgi:hypothetical protein
VRSRETPLFAAFCIFFAFAFAAACGPSQEKIEADRVLHAINKLRDSPSEHLTGREALVTELERVSATSPPAVKARDACAHAYRLLVDGKKLSERVAKQLADPKTVTLEAARDLADAESKILESAAAMPTCETAVADLRRPGAAGR